MASYKIIVKNAKVILKTVTNAVLNITGIRDLLTGSGSVDSNTKIDWTLQHYTNTAANFTSINPTLLVGQVGIETDDLLTAPKYKIGDGVTAWNTLPYNSSGGGGLSGLTTNKVLKATSSTTAGDSNITDNGSNVNISIPTKVLSNLAVIGVDNELKVESLISVDNGGYFVVYDDLGNPVLELDGFNNSIKKNGVEVATVNDIKSSILINHSATFNPADATTYYHGSIIATAPTTATNSRRIYLGQDVTIIGATFTSLVSGVNGTSEDVTVYIRVNGTTDTLVGTIKMNSGTQQVVINSSLNLALTSTDYFEIKLITPTWVTNPTNVAVAAIVNFR